jgi:non-canonical purine NTP pyrophosphatase (RdgB/HAM1 family)
MSEVVFITGNQNKADYFAKLMGLPIAHQKVDLHEIQSPDINVVVEHKVRQAYELVKKPVLVEDIALGFEALGGLPGPFIKYFAEQPDGPEKLCRMLDGFSNRRATGTCVYGYYDGSTLKLFRGEIHGDVADHPRGERGFGWDDIFCPDGYDGRTRAELNEQEYDDVYQIIRPFSAVKAFLLGLSDG